MTTRADAGFTLLEVLVAMTILAVAASGLLVASDNSLKQMQVLEQKTQAEWVAENRLAELRGARAWPEPGVTSDKVTLAEQEWDVRVTVTQTQQDDMRQLEVEVFKGSPVALAGLSGFVGRN
jgi:general secretion pathway protein I